MKYNPGYGLIRVQQETQKACLTPKKERKIKYESKK